MDSLDGKAWSWYEGLPPANICSLRVFHSIFYEKYKESHPSLSLVNNCCDQFGVFIQNLEDSYDDNEFMDEEILEALHDNIFNHQKEQVFSLMEENDDVYCLDVHKDFPQEKILVAVQ